jgi:hypothetical protein
MLFDFSHWSLVNGHWYLYTYNYPPKTADCPLLLFSLLFLLLPICQRTFTPVFHCGSPFSLSMPWWAIGGYRGE